MVMAEFTFRRFIERFDLLAERAQSRCSAVDKVAILRAQAEAAGVKAQFSEMPKLVKPDLLSQLKRMFVQMLTGLEEEPDCPLAPRPLFVHPFFDDHGLAAVTEHMMLMAGKSRCTVLHRPNLTEDWKGLRAERSAHKLRCDLQDSRERVKRLEGQVKEMSDRLALLPVPSVGDDSKVAAPVDAERVGDVPNLPRRPSLAGLPSKPVISDSQQRRKPRTSIGPPPHLATRKVTPSAANPGDRPGLAGVPATGRVPQQAAADVASKVQPSGNAGKVGRGGQGKSDRAKRMASQELARTVPDNKQKKQRKIGSGGATAGNLAVAVKIEAQLASPSGTRKSPRGTK